jgi:SAM-dependent methyltransferase
MISGFGKKKKRIRQSVRKAFDRARVLRGFEPDPRPTGVRERARRYQRLLSDGEIERGIHREIIGSPSTTWEGAGRFQLHLLREMGLEKGSTLLDIGCGPGRGSEAFIESLDESNYLGVDSNSSYIRACELMVAQRGLIAKRPRFEVSDDFRFETGGRQFDFAVAFSVVQYCPPRLRRAFFRNIPPLLRDGGKLYISHANWFGESEAAGYGVAVTRRIEAEVFDLSEFGWIDRKSGAGVFPIVEVMRMPT